MADPKTRPPKAYSKLRPLPSRQGKPSNRLGIKYPHVIEREAKAFELRKAGANYSEIARALQVSVTYAHDLVRHALDQMCRSLGEDVPAVRAMEVARLDDMLKALYPQVLKGHEKSIDSALKVAERRAKLLGLDAPAQHQLAGDPNNPVTINVVQTLTDDELDTRIQRLQKLLTAIPLSATALPGLAAGPESAERTTADADDGASKTSGETGGAKAS